MKFYKTKLLLTFFIFIVLGYLVTFLTIKKNHHYQKKKELLKIINLPDLAISTEANFIRNRSITTMFEIYKEDPDIRVYFPSSFCINEGISYEKN